MDVIYAVKFKLDPLDTTSKQELDDYFFNYQKVVNFAAKTLQKFEKRFVTIPGIKKVGNKFIKPIGKCFICNVETELSKLDNFTGEKICFDCFSKEYGKKFIRKKLYAARGRKVDPNINLTNAGKISKTHYNYACRDAILLLDALKKLQKKRFNSLSRNKFKLNEFKEILNEPEKRFRVEVKNERVPHYLHIKNKEITGLRPYTLSKVNKKINLLERNISRDEKTLNKDQPILFKGNRIQLGNNSVKFDFDNRLVYVSLFKKNKYRLILPSNKKNLDYFNDKINKIKSQKPKYSYLLRKKTKNGHFEYFIQYTISESVPEITEYSGVIGIDRGVNHLAVLSFVDTLNKISNVRFLSSKPIISMKVQDRKHKKLLKNKHHRLTKIKNIRPILPKINLYLHTISKEIVDLAKKLNAAIALEDLKISKSHKSQLKESKNIKYKLRTLFTYSQLGKLIQFKAAKEGIKTILVPPEGTSYCCYRCGSVNTTRPYKNTYSLMYCKDEGIEINADFNASVNIAKEGLNILKNK